jgi:preprotein translocase subunit SecG
MTTIVLIIHLLIALALVGVILLQRSEGGALGIGGGGMGGLMTGRASANLLTRVTAVLAAAFITTSLLLALLAAHRTAPTSILDQPAQSTPEAPAAPTAPAQPAAPAGPAAPAEPAAPTEPAPPSAPVAN